MLITDGDKKIVSAPVATYPSLAELAWLKGMTSKVIDDDQIDTFGELQTIVADEVLLKSGTLTDAKYCIYDSASTDIICDSTPAGTGDLLADGTVPMTSDWDIGNFDLTLKSITGDGTIEGATLTEGGVGVPNTGDKLSVFAATSSAELAGVLSDEDNTGACAADKVCMGGHTHVVPVRHAIAFEDPVATDDFFFGEVAATTTWTSIYCKTLVGTVTLDVTSGGTDIEGTDIVCDTDGQADAGISNTTGTVGHEIKLAITSVATSPTYLMVILNGTTPSQ